jgi:hypothetical protein
MRKLLLILFLIGSALYGQTPITTNTLNLPKQTTRPAAPTTGAKIYDFNHYVEIRDSSAYSQIMRGLDSLIRFVTPTQLGDSVGNYVLRDGTRQLTGDWNAGAFKISNTDSIQSGYLKSTGNAVVTDSLTVADRAYSATTWNNSMRVPTSNAIRDKIESLIPYITAEQIWVKDADSTTSSYYPVNLSALRLLPDSRYTIASIPNVRATYGDTLEISQVISGSRVFGVYGVADGAGGIQYYGIKAKGKLEADSIVTSRLRATGQVQGDSINAVTKYLLNGVDIRVTGTLDTIAYIDQDNNFTVDQTITGRLYATDVHATDSISAASFFASDSVKTAHFQLSTTPSNGYVLKCDADGNGSWEAITNAYKGTWDAHTNTPTLIDGTGSAGDFYLVSVGDTIDLGSGDVIFLTGGTAIYSGTVWEAINPSQIVTSVNSLIGDVQLDLSLDADTLSLTGGASVDISLASSIVALETGTLWERELEADSENDFTVSFPIHATAKVFYNGWIIPTSLWSGEGTTTLTLALDTRKYDTVIITN